MIFPLNWGVVKRCVPARRAGAASRPRIIGLLAGLAAAVLLGACGAVKVAYNQAPELAYWYLDAYLDFNGEQSLRVKEELGKLQAWHRQTQLPVYIESLQKARQQMPGELDSTQACAIISDLRGKLLALSSQAEPAVAAVAGQLGAPQLAHMARKFSKTDAEFRDDFIDASPQAVRQKRYKQAVKRAEMLYGRLEDRQLAVIGQRIDASAFDAQLSFAEKRRRQRDALQTLTPLAGGQAPPEKVQLAVHGLLERMANSPEPAHRAYQDRLTQDACKTFADLHNSTTPAQRNKAAEVLAGYERDFQALNSKKS